MTNLTTLKRRLGTDDEAGDELFVDLLCDAENYVLGYTGRSTVPERLNGVVLELAAIGYNRLGMQGESAHSEGGVAVSADSLPDALRKVLDRYRIARVV
ncbi:MAG: phage head-tail connector protein [Eubacteriales bacterium]|nr:phage head-tail connector protein [Eubacteriales bacterium]